MIYRVHPVATNLKEIESWGSSFQVLFQEVYTKKNRIQL